MLSSSVRLIIVNSQSGRQLLQSSGFLAAETLTIRNGIDLHRYAFSGSARQRVRLALGIPADARVVGHVARFHPMKDHQSFLRAAVKIAGGQSDVYFLLVGREVYGENESLVELIPESLRLRFFLLGDRDDIPSLMSAMDVFCLSSAWGEGFPNVLAEAMAVGLPCVATDIGDSSLVLDGEGILVASGNDLQMNEAISRLLTVDCRVRADIRRRSVSERFSVDRMVDEFELAFSRMVPGLGEGT